MALAAAMEEGAMSPIRARFGTALNALLYTTDSDWAREVYSAYRTHPDIKFRSNVANDAVRVQGG